ncbi:Uncharacterised protein [Bordetella pertussis]|nr:Uncharacterised protein [Bordetella pertussis]
MAIRGVPRERRATSCAPSAVMSALSRLALRVTMRASSSVL